MTSTTHIIYSTVAVMTVHMVTGEPIHLVTILIAGFTSMLPDIDNPKSYAGRWCKTVSRFLHRTVGHRTLTHSVFGWLIAAILFYPLKYIPLSDLYRAAIIGFVSHTITDLGNLEGVCLTYPFFPHHRWVIPGNMDFRIKVGSERERTFRFIGLVIVLGLLWIDSIESRTILRNIIGVPKAMAIEHYQQLQKGYQVVVRIRGVWNRGQGIVDGEEFNLVGSTNSSIFVRRQGEPLKIYQVSRERSTAIGGESNVAAFSGIP